MQKNIIYGHNNKNKSCAVIFFAGLPSSPKPLLKMMTWVSPLE